MLAHVLESKFLLHKDDSACVPEWVRHRVVILAPRRPSIIRESHDKVTEHVGTSEWSPRWKARDILQGRDVTLHYVALQALCGCPCREKTLYCPPKQESEQNKDPNIWTQIATYS